MIENNKWVRLVLGFYRFTIGGDQSWRGKELAPQTEGKEATREQEQRGEEEETTDTREDRRMVKQVRSVSVN